MEIEIERELVSVSDARNIAGLLSPRSSPRQEITSGYTYLGTRNLSPSMSCGLPNMRAVGNRHVYLEVYPEG